MKKISSIQQAHFFTNNDDIPATPVIISSLLSKLGKMELIPTTGSEINGITGERKTFVRMITPDEKFQIHFISSEIVIVSNDEELDSFLNKCQEALTLISEIFPTKKSDRLSILSTELYHSENRSTYENIYKRLFNDNESTPFEWDYRAAYKKTILNEKEKINSIETIKRGDMIENNVAHKRTLDTIAIDIDSNTLFENRSLRFDIGDASKVFKELAKDSSNSLEKMRKVIVE